MEKKRREDTRVPGLPSSVCKVIGAWGKPKRKKGEGGGESLVRNGNSLCTSCFLILTGQAAKREGGKKKKKKKKRRPEVASHISNPSCHGQAGPVRGKKEKKRGGEEKKGKKGGPPPSPVRRSQKAGPEKKEEILITWPFFTSSPSRLTSQECEKGGGREREGRVGLRKPVTVPLPIPGNRNLAGKKERET